jgi:hypothetical protein
MVAGALAVWGATHMAASDELIHGDCGTAVQVRYYCPQCDEQITGAAVRMAEAHSDVA